MNLVVNARDAMPHGGKLTIETANVDARRGYARVAPRGRARAVRDARGDGHGRRHGRGDATRIFEPFFTTKEQGKGTGLGLSTVFGIVQQSGGGIWVYSEPGRGTTFKVYLPRTDAAPESTGGSVLAVGQRGTETILLVEDEEAVRVVGAAHARAARLQGARRAGPRRGAAPGEKHGKGIDLLLTDVVMPRMSGASWRPACARAARDEGPLHVGLHRRHRDGTRRARERRRVPAEAVHFRAAGAQAAHRAGRASASSQ